MTMTIGGLTDRVARVGAVCDIVVFEKRLTLALLAVTHCPTVRTPDDVGDDFSRLFFFFSLASIGWFRVRYSEAKVSMVRTRARR